MSSAALVGVRMTSGCVTDRTELGGEPWWIVETGDGLRYHLRPNQFRGCVPWIGLKGSVGYIQGAVALVQVFIAAEPRSAVPERRP